MGLLVPAIRVRDNMQIGANQYMLKLRGIDIAHGEIFPGQLLAMDPGSATEQIHGVDTVEPAFGLPAKWIAEVQRTDAEIAGYTVVDALTVLVTHVSEVVRKHAPDIITRQDVQVLVQNLKAQSPAVVDELIPSALSLSEVQKVLQNLLAERVSVRDMQSILECLGDYAAATRDTDVLTEYVRQRLSRSICQQYVGADGKVLVFTLNPALEQTLAESLRQTEMGVRMILDPTAVHNVLNAVKTWVDHLASIGRQPVAMCSPRIRPHFHRLVEHSFPMLVVLSYNEIPQNITVESIGMVTLTNES
jgi:flagellar biosynthesis protein FlhA